MAVDEEPEPEPDDPTDIDELDATDAADQKVQDLADDRAWVEACLHVISSRFERVDRSYHVQRALDRACIESCRRLARMMRGDLRRAKK